MEVKKRKILRNAKKELKINLFTRCKNKKSYSDDSHFAITPYQDHSTRRTNNENCRNCITRVSSSLLFPCHRDLSIITCTQPLDGLSRILNTISCSLNLFLSLFIAKCILELIRLVLFLLYISFFFSFRVGTAPNISLKHIKQKPLSCYVSPSLSLTHSSQTGKKFNCEIFLHAGTIHKAGARAHP